MGVNRRFKDCLTTQKIAAILFEKGLNVTKLPPLLFQALNVSSEPRKEKKGDMAVAKFLIATIQDPDRKKIDDFIIAKDDQENTKLHAALDSNNPELAGMLIVAVQNPEKRYNFITAKNNIDRTALLPAMYKSLLRNGAEATIELVKKVIAAIQNPNDRDNLITAKHKDYGTALHAAVAKKDIETARVLIDAIQDPVKKIALLVVEGRMLQTTALEYAKKLHDSKMVEMLERYYKQLGIEQSRPERKIPLKDRIRNLFKKKK